MENGNKKETWIIDNKRKKWRKSKIKPYEFRNKLIPNFIAAEVIVSSFWFLTQSLLIIKLHRELLIQNQMFWKKLISKSDYSLMIKLLKLYNDSIEKFSCAFLVIRNSNMFVIPM